MTAIPASPELPPVPQTPMHADCLPVPADVRLDHLFRSWLRDRHVHPLIHLMRQYRARESE